MLNSSIQCAYPRAGICVIGNGAAIASLHLLVQPHFVQSYSGAFQCEVIGWAYFEQYMTLYNMCIFKDGCVIDRLHNLKSFITD